MKYIKAFFLFEYLPDFNANYSNLTLCEIWLMEWANYVNFLCTGLFQFDFAIMVASFKSRSSAHDVYYQKPITCPTLHVYGDTDKVIPKGTTLKCKCA